MKPSQEQGGALGPVVAWLAALPEVATVAILGAAFLLVLCVVGLVVYRVLGRGKRGALGSATSVSLLSTLVLGAVALTSPEDALGRFRLADQVVRGAAALSALVLTLSALSLFVPRVLNFLERGDVVAFIAARHVRSKKSGFLTMISALSISGVAISSFALCAVVSIMGGFGADLKQKILDNNAHVRIQRDSGAGFSDWRAVLDTVRATPGVLAATPVAGGEVMASSSTNTAGMILRGVENQSFGSVVQVPNRMEVGSFRYLDDPLALRLLPPETPIGVGSGGEVFLKGKGPDDVTLGPTDPTPDDVYPGVVLGRELARNLHAYVGDVLTLVSPMGDLGPMGLMPRTRKFRVAGIFYTGMYEYDASHAYAELTAAEELLDLGHLITAIDVRVREAPRADEVTRSLSKELQPEGLVARSWTEMNRSLFSALELEKIATFVILSIAIAVASFCIICTLLLMVTEKSKEIAILKAMGSSDGSVLRLFMTEGMLIGGVGTTFGVISGYILMMSLKHFGVRLDPDVYYIERLPVHVDEVDYVLIALCAFVITTLATLYPALAASRLRPVDGIRYE